MTAGVDWVRRSSYIVVGVIACAALAAYMGPVVFSQALLNSLVLGLTLTLVALGLSLVFGILGILNLAHGQVYAVAGYVVWWLYAKEGISYWLAIVAAGAVAIILSMGMERVMRPLGTNLMASMVMGLGLIYLILGGLQEVLDVFKAGFGAMNVPSYFTGMIDVAGVKIAVERVAMLVVSIALITGTIAFLRLTKTGRATRAVALDEEAAALYGVSVPRIRVLTMAIGGVLAAAAAGLLVPMFGVEPTMGLPILFTAFIAVILGGMGSVGGVVVAGLIIGSIQSFAATILGSSTVGIVLFLTLCAILLIRPQGIAGQLIRE